MLNKKKFEGFFLKNLEYIFIKRKRNQYFGKSFFYENIVSYNKNFIQLLNIKALFSRFRAFCFYSNSSIFLSLAICILRESSNILKSLKSESKYSSCGFVLICSSITLQYPSHFTVISFSSYHFF